MRRWVWAAMLAVVLGICVLAPQPTTGDSFEPPSQQHLLGTDQLGRDVLTRTLAAGERALLSGLLALSIAVIGGGMVGGAAAMSDRWVDSVLMRVVDVMLALPSLLIALVIIATTSRGAVQVAAAVGVALIPTVSRVVRAAVRSEQVRLYVEAAVAAGAGRWRVLGWHIFPNIRQQLIAFSGTVFAWALLNVAALEFLGLSGSPSDSTWGRMINEGRLYLQQAPWAAAAPSALLTFCVLCAVGISRRE